MAEKPITQKLTKIIKDADKLIQDIEKGAGRIIGGVRELKELRGKPEDKEHEQQD